jgi:hypothetical protein
MSRDDPAVAESLVVHAEALCERENHLWDVISKLSIPVDLLTDTRNQSQADYETEEMVRSFLYMQIRGFSQNTLADRLSTRPTLVKSFGFDISDLDGTPRQQEISYVKEQFSDETWEIIKAAAEGIGQAAVEHDVISEGLVPVLPDEDAVEDDVQTDKEYQKEKANKLINLARKHVLPEFDTGRAAHRTYSDEAILDMFARICANKGSAHSEGEYGWLTDDDLTCDDETFLRAIKLIATPEDGDAQTTLSDHAEADAMPKIDRIRDTLMESFDAATENVINSIRGDDPFEDRKTIAAIDITYEQYHVWPWEDKDAGIPKPGFPRMVSGYKKDDEYLRGYKHATITLVGDNAPIILGVEPVKENSKWEPDGSPSYSKGDIVARLLDKAQRFVDLDEVLLDRGFYSNAVYAEINDRDLLYTSPVPKYEDDFTTIKNIEAHNDADAAVKHDVPFGRDGEVHHTAEFLYTPTTSDDADGNYAVFVTNRDRAEPEEIDKVCNTYDRRWDIESQFKSVKSFLPKTSSKDYRVRLCKFVLASLIYNLWRLTDYLLKVAMDEDIWSPPVITAKTFVRALGEFLRDIG